MNRGLGALALWALAASPAAAQAVSDAPSAASVTIYRDRNIATGDLGTLDPNQGLALITETRTVEVPAGASRIAFRGVADTMVPETVAVEGLPGQVVERNEDFDLLSPGSLVARSVGRTVRVVQTDRGGGKVSERQAVIRAGPQGVLLDFGGRLEALGCDGVPTRLVFDHEPAGLGDKPTFSVLANLPQAGRYTVKLSYLATGFSWSADYVARIRPEGRTLDLAGWLTLSNKSSAGFAQAPTQVVAGELERDPATVPPRVETQEITPECWGQEVRFAAAPPLPVPMVERRAANMIQEVGVTAAKRQAVLSELGDYKLYTLPEPTTVAARQTKQVAFLDQPAVPFERVYVYRLDPYAAPDPEQPQQAPDVVLRLQNKAKFGLGKPLPSGTVSVMEPGGGGLVLAGQQAVRDTPVGLPLELTIGRAMDIAVAPRVTRDLRDADLHTRSVAVAIANGKPGPILLEFHQPRIGRSFAITSASGKPTPKAGDEVWTLRLRSGERAQLNYVMTYRD
ncbi:MAG: hypothetical protein JWP28_2036 [Phenylobacterium sp.]|uniref:DUF4139 domain-containing protein n=1 Tax=Phenylobacterium sp. TaxID=1871053 RepID=UPI0026354071|nr:hypothetical protein [Phenylobacterium sp.]MDB5498005.1 hypothetical protein [Phenylobacterium sp.]